jgi:hypothetical protein
VSLDTRFVRILGIALLGGCSFDSSGVASDDGGVATVDASTVDADPAAPDANTADAPPGTPDAIPAPDAGPDPITEDVVHVPSGAEQSSHDQVVLSGSVTINTENLTFGGGPAPAPFDAVAQDGGDGELAILHVKTLTVMGGANVRVVGTRPFVVIASGAIVVDGLIDAGARRATPGAGGSSARMGGGAGNNGAHVNGSFRDSGGGGAGFNTAGAKGGDATCNGGCGGGPAVGGAGGNGYGNTTQDRLLGGSGGGIGVSCMSETAGAGGGALQLYSGTSITIGTNGGLLVGGGGGGGGVLCSGNWGAGAGGGSGGSIFLQSPAVAHMGNLSANGGGGGSGAGEDDQNQPSAGKPGTDGALGIAAAPGGPAQDEFGSAGGNGGATSDGPTPGEAEASGSGNGGGGGGAVGRIRVITHSGGYTDPGSTNSPSVVAGTY